ncbi:uncharacterized protein V1510DRAFT_414472 [Dipodascopsis tothii]|uniref:uncharacterized protein n=1 Tax=Dipodascopsis tothii TaxID=44089 RepID=UPI0034CD9868
MATRRSKRSSTAGTVSVAETMKTQDFADFTREVGHFSMIRRLHLADAITLLNGMCGTLSVLSSLRYCLDPVDNAQSLWSAIALMPLGLFFDFMDGKVARLRRKSSLMGQELDSLADLISFGLAPAACAFCVGFRTDADLLVLGYFVLCGIARLARFNVTVANIPKDKSGKSKYFEGTPIPTTLSLVFLMAYWVHTDRVLAGIPGGVALAGTRWAVHPAVALFFASGCMMISKSLHVPKP